MEYPREKSAISLWFLIVVFVYVKAYRAFVKTIIFNFFYRILIIIGNYKKNNYLLYIEIIKKKKYFALKYEINNLCCHSKT